MKDLLPVLHQTCIDLYLPSSTFDILPSDIYIYIIPQLPIYHLHNVLTHNCHDVQNNYLPCYFLKLHFPNYSTIYYQLICIFHRKKMVPNSDIFIIYLPSQSSGMNLQKRRDYICCLCYTFTSSTIISMN